MLSKMSFFRPSKITNFVQNFVQISNFRPNVVELLKGIYFANGQIYTDFKVRIKKCTLEKLLMSALISSFHRMSLCNREASVVRLSVHL